MRYYDIHTHQPSLHPEDIAIVNTIIKENCDFSIPAQWCSAGIHPWYIHNVDKQISCLESVASSSAIVAIGEAGLDKLVKTPLDIQKNAFLRQAELAEKLNKPLIIHCVKAWGELIAIRKVVKPYVPWIIHGFRGNGELAQQLSSQGFYLSFGEHFNPAALQVVWPDRIFAETDDKELDIRDVYRQMASSLQLSLEMLTSVLEKNVHRVFTVV